MNKIWRCNIKVRNIGEEMRILNEIEIKEENYSDNK